MMIFALHLVLTGTGIVHDLASHRAQAQALPSTPSAATSGRGGEGLPAPVRDMRESILEAVRSGAIEDLRDAIELNELPPVIGSGGAPDPIARLRAMSADGEGRDVLEALGRLLDAGWIAVPLGPDVENSRVYVWPRFAETGLAALSAEERRELETLVPASAAAAMIASGRYAHWRLSIGPDGVWHELRR